MRPADGPLDFVLMSWDDLRKAVDDSGGVYRTYMAGLRALAGAGRLGPHVAFDISRHLAGLGLGHLPAELPLSQHAQVIVYQLGTPAADVVEAVRGDNPHRAEGTLARAEESLRRLNTDGDARKLAAIAAILNSK